MNDIKVMIVDDHEEILQFFQDVLKMLDYQVVKAKNGIDALKLFKTEKPDIVFLDIKMPKLNGIETLKRMRYLDKECNTIIFYYCNET